MEERNLLTSMDRKQLYLLGGVAGLILVVVAMMSYYIFTFKKSFETEQASRIAYEGKSAELQRELTTTQAALEAKKNKIGILESTIDEIQQRASNLSEAKAKAEAEKMKLFAEKRQREEEFRDLRESLQKEIQDKEIVITELRGMLTVNMMDKILFDSGKAQIKPEGKRVLEKIAETFLNRYPDREIRVEGHTDNVPFKGLVLNNWDLSTARAISAVRYLQEQAGVDPIRLAAVGYAFYRPIDTNDTPEGRARNRRIEIIVMPPKKEGLQE
ncbi:MAG: OmpA family protein [Candidatus Poribacteria bacterium]|nr:OmpA family protein [Candidatus Poribacteria bacterium]